MALLMGRLLNSTYILNRGFRKSKKIMVTQKSP